MQGKIGHNKKMLCLMTITFVHSDWMPAVLLVTILNSTHNIESRMGNYDTWN